MYEFESSYIDALADKVSEVLEINKNGTLLAMGGSWKFGKQVATLSEVNTYLYADSNETNVDDAHHDDVFTSQLEIWNPEELPQLGKFDAIILKEYIERLEDETDLGDLLAAIWKILKLNAKVALLVRFSPTFPVPKEFKENWENSMPTKSDFESVAQENDFDLQSEELNFTTSCAKEEYKQSLISLPVGGLEREVAEDFLRPFPETLEFEDKLTLIILTKVIN